MSRPVAVEWQKEPPAKTTLDGWAHDMPPRHLDRVEVVRLFGRYNHSFQLPTDASEGRILFLHGPNGIGKTTILRLISSYHSGDVTALKEVPFSSFSLYFDDGLSVVFQRDKSSLDSDLIVRVHSGQDEFVGLVRLPRSRTSIDGWHWWDWDASAASPSTLESELSQIDTYLGSLSGQGAGVLEVKLPRFRMGVISADRLMVSARGPDGKSVAKPRVVVQAEDLRRIVSRAQGRFAERARQIDRKFPLKLLEQLHDPEVRIDRVEKLLTDLDEREQWLSSLGLSEGAKSEWSNLLTRVRHGDFEGEDQALKVIWLHGRDSWRKLQTLDRLARQLEVFRDLLNSAFLDKRVEFLFQEEARYGVDDKGVLKIVPKDHPKQSIPLDRLSSGEQHLFSLIFSLLFESLSRSLVLIDEPELSLHVAWQRMFADALERIGELNDLSFILATHSPQIVGGRWDQMALLGAVDDEHDEPPGVEGSGGGNLQ